MNGLTITFALIMVLVFSTIQSSDAMKQICRCHDEFHTKTSLSEQVTRDCGKKRGLYCYNYDAPIPSPYCEVENRNDGFKKCCLDYGKPISGLSCKMIN